MWRVALRRQVCEWYRAVYLWNEYDELCVGVLLVEQDEAFFLFYERWRRGRTFGKRYNTVQFFWL